MEIRLTGAPEAREEIFGILASRRVNQPRICTHRVASCTARWSLLRAFLNAQTLKIQAQPPRRARDRSRRVTLPPAPAAATTPDHHNWRGKASPLIYRCTRRRRRREEKISPFSKCWKMAGWDPSFLAHIGKWLASPWGPFPWQQILLYR